MIRLDSRNVLARRIEAELNATPEPLAEARTRLDALHPHRPKRTTTMTKTNRGLPPAERDALRARMGLPTAKARIHWDSSMRTTRCFPVLAGAVAPEAPQRPEPKSAPGDDMPPKDEVIAFLRELALAGDTQAAELLQKLGGTMTDPKKDPETARRLAAMLPPKRAPKPFMDRTSLCFPVAGHR